MTKEKNIPIELVYVGIRKYNCDLFHVYIDLEELTDKKDCLEDYGDPLIHPSLQDNVSVFKKKIGRVRPGSVVTVQGTRAGGNLSVVNASATVTRYMSDELCLKWSAISRSEEDQHRIEQASKKNGARDVVEEHLQPLAELYQSLRDKNKKTVFLARVIQTITRSKP